MYSCDNENIIDNFEEELGTEIIEEDDTVGNEVSEVVTIEDTEEMIHLKELFRNSTTKTRAYSGTYHLDDNLHNNLYSIQDMPFYLISRDYNSGKQYLTSVKQSQELSFDVAKSNNTQTFYIKKYAPSLGMDNIIYSSYCTKPLVAGFYTSNPDTKIVFINNKEDITTSTDWSIHKASTNGYVYLTNASIYGMLDPNNYWSFYYPCIGLNTSNKLAFSKYTSGNSKQEFKLKMANSFKIMSIKFINDWTASVEDKGVKVYGGREIHYGKAEAREINFKINETSTASSKFTSVESIDFNLSNPSFLVKRPELIKGKIYLTENMSAKAVLPYNGSSYVENSGIEFKKMINLQTNSIFHYTFEIKKYLLGADYELTAQCYFNGEYRIVTIYGRWEGEVLSEDISTFNYYFEPLEENGGGDIPLRCIIF